jgi:methylmalonyl-CoA decarboxylase
MPLDVPAPQRRPKPMSATQPDAAAPVTAEAIDNIARITFSNPPVNALSHDVCSALVAAIDQLDKTRARVVVLCAKPEAKVWSAGHDVREIPLGGQDPLPWTSPLERLLHRVRSCPAPVIAMVHAGVWGGACDLVATCDIVVGTARATFAITPAKLGISYNTAGLTHFAGVLPLHVLKEMLFTGAPISAEDAHRYGMLNRLVDAERLEEATMDLARVIASRAPLAVAALKTELRSLTSGVRMSAEEFEAIQSARRAAFRSDDAKEGIQAFFEKRPPMFRGR